MSNYKRKPPERRVKDRILILCGGQTEEIYFSRFKEKYKDGLSNVTVKIAKSKYGNPSAIVDKAISLRNEYDELWCVFDKDDFNDFDEAIIKSSRYAKINCAFSNEAIEYWFVLHFSDVRGAISRKNLNDIISREFDIKYDKSSTIIEKICEKLEDVDIEEVEERAKRGYEYHELNSGKRFSDWRSCTSIFMLTKRLRKWNDANKSFTV